MNVFEKLPGFRDKAIQPATVRPDPDVTTWSFGERQDVIAAQAFRVFRVVLIDLEFVAIKAV